MNRQVLNTGAVLCCLIFVSATAFAGGFLVPDQGAKATSMGGAFVAQADDPTAVYYNPAGISQLEGTQVSAGLAVIGLWDTSFTSNGTSVFGAPGQNFDTKEQTFLIPRMFVTHKSSDAWSFGVGLFSDFGLGTEWEDTWEGRYIAGGTKSGMTTFGLNPVVTYSPSKRLSFGGGLVAQKMDVEFKSKFTSPLFPPGSPDANVELTGDSIGYGFNLGALFWATDNIKLGAAYRSKIAHDVSGDLKITGTPGGVGDVSENAESDLELPANLYLGAAYLWDKLTLEFDLQWTQWSSWDKLEATFVTQPKLSEPKNWKDSWTYRLGANYSLTPAWDLRAGIVFDPTPIPDDTLDPGVPAGDRWFYSIGCGYKVGKIILDLNYSYMAGGSRTFDNNVGNYGPAGNVTGEFQNLNSHNLLLNFTYLFGANK